MKPGTGWAELADLAQLLPYKKLKSTDWADLVADSLKTPAALAQSPASIRRLRDPLVRDQSWLGYVIAQVKIDPAAAQFTIGEIQSPDTRIRASSTIAAYLAVSDPPAAFHYAASLTDETARSLAERSIYSTWMGKRPSEASAYLQQHVSELSPTIVTDLALL